MITPQCSQIDPRWRGHALANLFVHVAEMWMPKPKAPIVRAALPRSSYFVVSKRFRNEGAIPIEHSIADCF